MNFFLDHDVPADVGRVLRLKGHAVQSLDEVNPPAKALKGEAKAGALASARMRFDVPDAAPTDKLNKILWHDVRGWTVAYPGVKRGAFAPLSLDIDDDDR